MFPNFNDLQRIMIFFYFTELPLGTWNRFQRKNLVKTKKSHHFQSVSKILLFLSNSLLRLKSKHFFSNFFEWSTFVLKGGLIPKTPLLERLCDKVDLIHKFTEPLMSNKHVLILWLEFFIKTTQINLTCFGNANTHCFHDIFTFNFMK